MRVFKTCSHEDLLNKKKHNLYKKKYENQNGKSFEEYFQNSRKELMQIDNIGNTKHMVSKQMKINAAIKCMSF
ncbi:hypothetical protein [Crassaminicella profunda]|uniref:hypothetical protein n=1 Tax=Crassaminicella profunda TaxID=1286698 RepID=UPI001CA6C92A|nr:hypothetical protein [Crassaminicella profunda]QZY53693.1 hypothetical protein K7H06_11540 [Crassaminicella profunda]